MSDFRTSAIRADLINKAEYQETSTWFRYTVIFASFVYFVITSVFWFDLLYSMFNEASFFIFFIVTICYIFTLSFPALIYSAGYIHAKNIEYNRYLDVTNLTGSIAGQLSMNSANMTSGVLEAVELGRQLEMTTQDKDNNKKYFTNDLPPIS